MLLSLKAEPTERKGAVSDTRPRCVPKSYSYSLAPGSAVCGFDWIAVLSHLILLF